MSGVLNMWSLEGSLERTEKTTHYVSLWYIPGGCAYSNAKPCVVFFEDEGAAKVFERKWSSPPEMAMIGTIEDYDRVKETCKRVFQEG